MSKLKQSFEKITLQITNLLLYHFKYKGVRSGTKNE